mmetsp:Transcript_31986/g.68111  ORF Transcript_31986/g.68111 Transcript_31986/m.68111 type:complete len:306 (+) Transcript_31986:972-1889(+)
MIWLRRGGDHHGQSGCGRRCYRGRQAAQTIIQATPLFFVLRPTKLPVLSIGCTVIPIWRRIGSRRHRWCRQGGRRGGGGGSRHGHGCGCGLHRRRCRRRQRRPGSRGRRPNRQRCRVSCYRFPQHFRTRTAVVQATPPHTLVGPGRLPVRAPNFAAVVWASALPGCPALPCCCRHTGGGTEAVAVALTCVLSTRTMLRMGGDLKMLSRRRWHLKVHTALPFELAAPPPLLHAPDGCSTTLAALAVVTASGRGRGWRWPVQGIAHGTEEAPGPFLGYARHCIVSAGNRRQCTSGRPSHGPSRQQQP